MGGIMFMMVWGLDMISIVKFHRDFSADRLLNPFHFSQLIYGTITLVFTLLVFRRLFRPRKYLWLVPGIAALLAGFILFRYLLEQWLYPLTLGYRNYPSRTTLAYYFLDNVYYAIIYIFLGASVFFADELVRSRKRQTALTEKNREAELAFLRSQINPHFLFNSLNNIYSLSYKKSEKTTDAIMKLSELMRYMLYEKKETVSLLTEWEYVHHFIMLQQLRYDYQVQTRLLIEGDCSRREIPPYVLITLAENAFKHGDFSQDKPFVLKVKADQDVLHCYCENAIALQQKDATGGIGLENIRRRLELMYENKHSIEIQKSERRFSISLQIRK